MTFTKSSNNRLSFFPAIRNPENYSYCHGIMSNDVYQPRWAGHKTVYRQFPACVCLCMHAEKKMECRIHTRAWSGVLMSLAFLFLPFYVMKSLTMKVPLFAKQNKAKDSDYFNYLDKDASWTGRTIWFAKKNTQIWFWVLLHTLANTLHRGTLNKYLVTKGSNHFPMSSTPWGILVGRPQPDLSLCTLRYHFQKISGPQETRKLRKTFF